MKLTTGEIIASIVATGGAIGGAIAWIRGRKQDKATTLKTIAEAGEIDSKKTVNITDAAYKLLDRVERQYSELENKHKGLEERFMTLELKFDKEQDRCQKEIDALKLLITQLTVKK